MGTRRKIIHASISNSMLHPHIMPEENSRTAVDNVCRQNREILRRSESSFLKRRFHNLCHEIFSHRFRKGVRGFWTFPTSTSPPPPPPRIPSGCWNQCFSKERIASYFSRIQDQLRVSAILKQALINNF